MTVNELPIKPTKMQMFMSRWKMAVGIIVTILGLSAALFKFDDRYVKVDDVTALVEGLQETVVREISLNRTVMISDMYRSVSEFKFQLSNLDELNSSDRGLIHFLQDRIRLIERDIRLLEIQQ